MLSFKRFKTRPALGRVSPMKPNKIHIPASNIKKVVKKTGGGIAKAFSAFLEKGGVVELTVGLVLGTSLSNVITSIVQDLISPFIGLATGGIQLENQFLYLKKPPICNAGDATFDKSSCSALNTPLLAQAAGAVTWNWGSFIQNLLFFFLCMLVLFLIVRSYSKIFRKPLNNTRSCCYCLSKINLKAIKCPFCASEQQKVVTIEDGTEDVGGSLDTVDLDNHHDQFRESVYYDA